MDGSYLLQMNLRSGRESTSSGAAHEGQGDSGRAIEHDSGGGQEVPPLAPHPFPPPPPPLPMTPTEMMAELMAARRETARAMDIMAQAVAGLACGGHGGNDGNGGGAHHPEG